MSKKRNPGITILIIAIVVVILWASAMLVYFLFTYTDELNDGLKTFYLEYRTEKILSTESKLRLEAYKRHEFEVKYLSDSDSEKGFSVKIITRDLGDNNFDYEADGKRYRWKGGEDVGEGFSLTVGEDYFILAPQNKSLEEILQTTLHSEKVVLGKRKNEENCLFSIVVSNYNESRKITVNFELIYTE